MAPKIGILAEPAHPYVQHKMSLASADRLTEYDILIIAPSAATFGRMAGTELQYESYARLEALIERRRGELAEFIAAGGVAAVLIAPFTSVRGQLRDDELYDYELFVHKYSLRRFGLVNESGTSRELLDNDDPIASYVAQTERWVCTLERGAYAEDPHHYPLAVNRQGRPIAYVEHVGRGTVYWVAPCSTDADWRRLLEGLQKVWSGTADPLHGLSAGQLQEIVAEEDRIQTESRRQLADLRARRDAVLAARQRLVEEDRDAARALQHYRAARHASPAKALDFLHRMVETIEHVYGNETKTLAELGYSKATLNDINKPANDKAYRARHEGGENKDVPRDELERAFAAADEILGRFLSRRLQERG
jgi:hypothetical protein